MPMVDPVVALFHAHFQRIYRYLDRLTDEPDLAAELAQETFVRLAARRSLPDHPEAWLITVANNLFRNAASTRARQRKLLTAERAAYAHADPPASPADTAEARDTRMRVRHAVDRLPERERSILLLRAEGFSYREIARALDLNEASIGTLLARAKEAFRETYHAS
jgi:RNA polymerase sigma-70 factor (ECF subfamily)